MPIDGAMIHASISRKLAQAERLGAICLEPRDRSIDQGLRQIPVAKGLTCSLPFRGHRCPHRAPYALARYEARAWLPFLDRPQQAAISLHWRQLQRMQVVSKSLQSHPDVIVFPPVILATALVLACMLQWLWPLGAFANMSQGWRITTGCVLVLVGVSLAAAGRRTLTRLGTNVSPLRPTTVLATNGVYQWTRNPLYTGGTAVMIGIAFMFALDWLVLLMAPALLILHFGVVHREEQYLEQKFGDSYREYKARVPRYGFGI